MFNLEKCSLHSKLIDNELWKKISSIKWNYIKILNKNLTLTPKWNYYNIKKYIKFSILGSNQNDFVSEYQKYQDDTVEEGEMDEEERNI